MKNIWTLSIVFVSSLAWAKGTIIIDQVVHAGNVPGMSQIAKRHVRSYCERLGTCKYKVTVDLPFGLNDPAVGYEKDFVIHYSCSEDRFRRWVFITQPENHKEAFLDCASAPVPYDSISIESATYGLSNPGVPVGNATEHVKRYCGTLAPCEYPVYFQWLGDPSPGNSKDFEVKYRCNGGTLMRAYLPAEAQGKKVLLTCNSAAPMTGTVQVISALYGSNIAEQAYSEPIDTTADVTTACAGRPQCNYTLNPSTLADPAPTYRKDFVVTYRCIGEPQTRQSFAGVDSITKTVTMNCQNPIDPQRIIVTSASYGANRTPEANNNATLAIRNACEGNRQCSFPVIGNDYVDPSTGNSKEFVVNFTCSMDNISRQVRLSGEASGQTAYLNCN